MSEENSKPKKLSLSGSGKLTLGGGALDQTALRGGNVGTGRAKNVQVEVRRKRVLNPALRTLLLLSLLLRLHLKTLLKRQQHQRPSQMIV